MTNPVKIKWTMSPVVAAILAAVSAPIAAVVPLAMLVVPALWVYAACKTEKPIWLALFAALYSACAMALYGSLYGGCLGCMALGMALVLYFFQTKKLGNAYTVFAMAALVLMCLYAAVCVPGILSGAGPYAAIEQAVDVYLNNLRSSLTALAFPAETETVFLQYFDILRESVGSTVVACLSAAGACLGLTNTLFFRLFAKGEQFPIAPMRPFSLWAVPGSMTFGIFALLIGSLILDWMDWDYADALSNAVNIMVGLPLMLQGLCMADFFILRSGKNVRGRRILIYVLCGLFLAFAQMPLMVLGCTEQLFHLRKRIIEGPPRPPQF